jgi:hypothetical protein
MALPTITFNASTGSDTAASGAGPATALTGTAASFSTATVTLDGSPSLTGVATDGSHVLWLKTSTGTQFFKITGKGTSTVDVTPNPAGTSTGRTWGIGGKRATFANADSRLLFSADAKPGWTIVTETDQTGLTTELVCTAIGDTTTGAITLKGDSTSNRRVLSSATNNISILNGGLENWNLQNLKFTSTASTKTYSYGINWGSANATGVCIIRNCVFGDATNKLQNAWERSASSQIALQVFDSEITSTLGYAFGAHCGTSGGALSVVNCWIHGCSGGGCNPYYGNVSQVWLVMNCLITGNTGYGFSVGMSPVGFIGNTIHGNSGASGDGIYFPSVVTLQGSVIVNNQITGNGRKGVYCAAGSAAVNDSVVGMLDYNNFGTGALANTSGATNLVSSGAHDLTVDPQYSNAASNLYTPGNAAVQAGYNGTWGV